MKIKLVNLFEVKILKYIHNSYIRFWVGFLKLINKFEIND